MEPNVGDENKIQKLILQGWIVFWVCFLLVSLFGLFGHVWSLLMFSALSGRDSELLKRPQRLLEGSAELRATSRTRLTWRSGSWVELPGWKRSQSVSCGSSSADAAQSRSWRWCTWRRKRWPCQGSGALRWREERESNKTFILLQKVHMEKQFTVDQWC